MNIEFKNIDFSKKIDIIKFSHGYLIIISDINVILSAITHRHSRKYTFYTKYGRIHCLLLSLMEVKCNQCSKVYINLRIYFIFDNLWFSFF